MSVIESSISEDLREKGSSWLLAQSFRVMLYTGDVFDGVDTIGIESGDYAWVLPIAAKYGGMGIFACASHILQRESRYAGTTVPLCYRWDGSRLDEYRAALSEIRALDPVVCSQRLEEVGGVENG